MLIRFYSLFSKLRSKAAAIALIAVLLAGVQMLQSSPWHDHQRETVDCALCHLQTLGDDSEIGHSLPLAQAVVATPVVVAADQFFSSHFAAPYQGRAPPLLPV
jgi:hypothetical protein